MQPLNNHAPPTPARVSARKCLAPVRSSNPDLPSYIGPRILRTRTPTSPRSTGFCVCAIWGSSGSSPSRHLAPRDEGPAQAVQQGGEKRLEQPPQRRRQPSGKQRKCFVHPRPGHLHPARARMPHTNERATLTTDTIPARTRAIILAHNKHTR